MDINQSMPRSGVDCGERGGWSRGHGAGTTKHLQRGKSTLGEGFSVPPSRPVPEAQALSSNVMTRFFFFKRAGWATRYVKDRPADARRRDPLQEECARRSATARLSLRSDKRP